MYIATTGSKNNKDVYIYQSFRKETENLPLAYIKNWGSSMIFFVSLMAMKIG